MATKSYWIKSGSYTLLQRVSVLGFGMLNVMMLARMLDKPEFGLWTLFLSIGGFLEVLRNGFIRNPLVATLSHEDTDRGKVMTSSFYLNTVISVVMMLVLLIAAQPLSRFWDVPGLESMVYVYAVSNLIFIFFSHFEYIQHASLDFRGIFISYFVRTAVLTLYIAYHFFVVGGIDLFQTAIAQAVGLFVGMILGYGFAKKHLQFDFKHLRDKINELLHFGKYTFGTNISTMIMKSTDTWMLGRIINSDAVAEYNPAIRIANLVEVPTLAVASVVLPQVSKSQKDAGKQGVKVLYEKSVGIILAAMLPAIAFLLVFTDWITTLLFGSEYLSSVPIIHVTIFYALIIPYLRQFGTVLDAMKKPKVNFYFVLVTALLNVIFNYIFISQMGVIGAAYGTLVSYIISLIGSQVILYKMYGINIFNTFIYMIRFPFEVKKYIKR